MLAPLRGTWPREPLGTVADVVSGFAFKSSEFGERGIPVIKIKNVRVGHIDLSDVEHVDEKYLNIPDRYHVRGGDVLISLTGSHISQPNSVVGRVARHSSRLPNCLLNQRAGKVIIKDSGKCDLGFLFYALSEQETVRAIAMKAHGAANQANVSPTQVESIEIPLPSLPLQRRIAGILSVYDDLMENCQSRIRILETMVPALYREWFVHFRFPGHENVKCVASTLGEIPKGWEVGRLDDVLVLQRGFDLPKANRADGQAPIYAATGVVGFHNEAKVKAPGIVTGRSGTIGDVLYVQEDFWPLNTALWVKEFPKSEPLYAYYLLSSLDLKQFNSGAAVPTLNRNDIHGLEALIPPRSLQKKFQEIAVVMLRQARNLELQIHNLRRTRDLLLPRLLSGQVELETEAA